MDVVSMFRHLGRIVINNTSLRQGAVLRGRCEWYAVPKAPLFSDVTDVDWFCACTYVLCIVLRISISASHEFSHNFITYKHTDMITYSV